MVDTISNMQRADLNSKPHVGKSITAKGPPKILNSAAFGMKISWPEMMLECCLRIQIGALGPPLLLYSSKTRI